MAASSDSESTSSNFSTAKTILSTVASAAATVMLVRTISNEYLPDEFTTYISGTFRRYFSSQMTIVVEEYEGLVGNEIYDAAAIYLGSKASSNDCRLKVSRPEKEKSISVAVDRNEQINDEFHGAKIKWIWICQEVNTKNFHNPRSLNSTQRSEIRSFELSFHKKYKKMILESYLPYILKEAENVKNLTKSVKIFTVDPDQLYGNMSDAWMPVPLDHPSNFDTLAIDSDLKQTIIKDLDRFVSRRDYYRKVGKAWKRGYLLYGPPGTGKSSLIAAMANHLNFDIYDLELTAIENNSDLRRLLLATANRSILVVEDIDCSVQFHYRAAEEEESNKKEKKVTLSGFLNFVDGLWSSCGDERIIIFTTNHKEKLDPALLRPGRMDMHILMFYCTPCGFKTLVRNYLDVDDHKLFTEIEELIETINVTPAEVAEQLLKYDEENIDIALSNVVNFLHEKKKENEEAEAKKETVLLQEEHDQEKNEL